MASVKATLHERAAKIRFKGVFDFKKLYAEAHAWAEERDFEFYEKQYKHKWKTPGVSAEVEIKWEMVQEINEFAKNVITVYFHIWDYKDIEVIKDGKKVKLVHANMFIDFNGYVELDWQGKWDTSDFKRKLRGFYINNIVRHHLEDVWWDKLWYNTNKLQQMTKQVLGMYSHSDVYDDMW